MVSEENIMTGRFRVTQPILAVFFLTVGIIAPGPEAWPAGSAGALPDDGSRAFFDASVIGEIWLEQSPDKWININDLLVEKGFAEYKEY